MISIACMIYEQSSYRNDPSTMAKLDGIGVQQHAPVGQSVDFSPVVVAQAPRRRPEQERDSEERDDKPAHPTSGQAVDEHDQPERHRASQRIRLMISRRRSAPTRRDNS